MSTVITHHSRKQMFQLVALFLCVVSLVGVIMIGTATTAYCADAATNIQEAFSNMTKKIYDIMRAVIIPCCIVALGFAGFQFIVGGNQGAEKARKVVIGVVCAVFFVVFAPVVMSTIGGFVTTEGSGTWSDYNPLD